MLQSCFVRINISFDIPLMFLAHLKVSQLSILISNFFSIDVSYYFKVNIEYLQHCEKKFERFFKILNTSIISCYNYALSVVIINNKK